MLQKIHNPLDACGLKFAGSKGEFEGYASVFNGIDSYGDTILPGAYEKTLQSNRSPSMFVNHRSIDVPVGDWISLKEDNTGLIVKGRIDLNHKDGPTVFSALKRGAMDGLSIGFTIPEGGETEKDGVREISEISLKEISVVNFPADDEARVSIVKADFRDLETLRDYETFLRDSGVFTKSAAIALISRIKELARRDAELELDNKVAEKKKAIKVNDQTQKLVNLINRRGI